MLTTAVMIKLGRVEDNRMVDMQLTNNKLIERGTAMISQTLGVNSDTARQYLLEEKSVRKAIEKYRWIIGVERAANHIFAILHKRCRS